MPYGEARRRASRSPLGACRTRAVDAETSECPDGEEQRLLLLCGGREAVVARPRECERRVTLCDAGDGHRGGGLRGEAEGEQRVRRCERGEWCWRRTARQRPGARC